MQIAVLVNRNPLDQFHHKVRNTVLGRAPIEQVGDGRMVERRQNLALMTETFQYRRRVVPAAHEFQGHLLFILAISSSCPVHRSHTALANLLYQLINADATTDAGAYGICLRPCPAIDHWLHQKSGGRLQVVLQEGLDFAAELRISAADAFQIGAAARSIQRDRLVERVFDLLPAFGSHFAALWRAPRRAKSHLAIFAVAICASSRSSFSSSARLVFSFHTSRLFSYHERASRQFFCRSLAERF